MATITKIEIAGFKAFPQEFSLDLEDGKNLLMYGENGSGKSSIYYALHALLQSVFKDDKGAKYFKIVEDAGSIVNIENLVNIHRIEDVKSSVFRPYVQITLDNGNAVWKIDDSGIQSPTGIDLNEIKMMNKNAVFINHSFISRFHAARNSEEMDLWNVFYKDILPFYVPSGQSDFLASKYDEIIEQSRLNPSLANKDFAKQISYFNNDLSSLINDANKQISSIYNQFFKNVDDTDLEITLCYYSDDSSENSNHYPYYLFYGKNRFGERMDKKLHFPRIGICIKENGQEILKPQSYFNEAKLTAIALSVRFSCLPQLVENGAFMALDDMLISLDMSNRMKVVDFLLNVVSDKYKIYLFTHDKAFFEYFKHKSKKETSKWLYKEIYIDEQKQPHLKKSETYLGNAEYFINQHEYEIAGNFLRKEAEAFCKDFLPKKLQYSPEYSLLDLNGLICNSKKFAEESHMADTVLFDALDDHRKFVLNPASHDSYDVAKYEYEIKKCFETLIELRRIKIHHIFKKGQKLEFTLNTPAPNINNYKFEITVCDEIRLIIQEGQEPILSKGVFNYVVAKNGNAGKVQSDNSTLKHFYDVNYQKSDKTLNSNFLDSVIEVATRCPIRNLL